MFKCIPQWENSQFYVFLPHCHKISTTNIPGHRGSLRNHIAPDADIKESAEETNFRRQSGSFDVCVFTVEIAIRRFSLVQGT